MLGIGELSLIGQKFRGSFRRELRGTQNMQNIQIHTCLFSIGFTFNLVYVKIPHIFLADELLVNVVYVFRCNDLMGNSLKRTSRQCAAYRRTTPLYGILLKGQRIKLIQNVIYSDFGYSRNTK